MSTTAVTAQARFRLRRGFPVAGSLQSVIWLLVVVLVLGPFVPLLYASVRDRPLYEHGGVFTLDAYSRLLGDSQFWHAARNTLADVYAKVGAKNVYFPGFTQKFVNARPAFAKEWHSIFG